MISGGNGADTLDHRDYSELKLVDRRVWYFVGWHQRNPHSVRHAQGLHNLSHANHHLPDPGLTPLGEDQARSLACSFLGADKIGTIELVLASPLRRTIQTALALLASPPCMPAAVDGSGGSIQRVVAWPEVQEASHLPCDTGSPLDEIRAQFAHAPVDFAMVESGWHVKQQGKWTPTVEMLLERGKRARRWLRRRPEKNILVVSHGCFLHFLTDDWVDAVNSHATSWDNAEVRTFVFEDEHDSDNIALCETEESRLERGLVREALSVREQHRLRETSLKTWVEWGVISP
ncbi:histidine phosphatase superfamily [Nemania serpens]|nr:histidine phosphatase superfamily [Nemania serpens]